MLRVPNRLNPPYPGTIYWTVVAAICVGIAACLTLNSSAPGWISEAAQAEFASTAPAEPAAAQMAERDRLILPARAK